MCTEVVRDAHASSRLRVAAVAALGRMNDREVYLTLAAAGTDATKEVAQAAQEAAARLRPTGR